MAQKSEPKAIMHLFQDPPFKEVLFSSDESYNAWNCCVWDPIVGNTLALFKEGNSRPHCLAMLGHDYLVSAFWSKPMLKFWSLTKEKKEEITFAVPGEVTALAICPMREHCVAGIGNKLYVWDIATGELCTIISFHHQIITCIKFTSDGSHFVASGKDALISVWVINEILMNVFSTKPNKPLYVWNDHTNDVTDIYIGYGGTLGRVVTTSADCTCRIYSIDEGMLLFTIYMNVELNCVVIDGAELFLSIGAQDGKIYQVKLYSHFKQGSVSSINSKNDINTFNGHKGAVTCISSSFDGTLLASGSSDTTVKVWDVITRQCLSSIQHIHRITNLFFTIAPACLLKRQVFSPTTIIKRFNPDVTTDFSSSVFIEKYLKRINMKTSYKPDTSTSYPEILCAGATSTSSKRPEELQDEINVEKNINHQLYSMTMDTFLYSIKKFDVFEQ